LVFGLWSLVFGLWSLVFGLDYQVLTVVVSVTRVEVQDQRPTTTISLPP